MPDLSRRLIAMIVGGIVLLLLLGVTLNQCSKRRSEAAQARVERSQAEAASNSAADAIGSVARSGEATAASEEMTRTSEREIRAAEGAGERVGAGVNAAGRSALCRREAYRNDPKCKGAGR